MLFSLVENERVTLESKFPINATVNAVIVLKDITHIVHFIIEQVIIFRVILITNVELNVLVYLPAVVSMKSRMISRV